MSAAVAQYFGVAATSAPEEAQGLLEILDITGLPEGVQFMNGPLVSRKTLLGQLPDNPALYPPVNLIANLLPDDPRVFNVIHFNSRDPRLLYQLAAIAEISPLVHGIQLNILWPDPTELERFRQMYPSVKLILQLSRFSYDSVGGDLAALAECLRRYDGLAEYVLFDPSGGTGQDYNRLQAAEVLTTFIDSGLDMVWGVTGGLRADRIQGLTQLLRLYPRLCWDAQTNLRTPVDQGNRLDLESCFGFCATSAALLMRQQRAGSF